MSNSTTPQTDSTEKPNSLKFEILLNFAVVFSGNGYDFAIAVKAKNQTMAITKAIPKTANRKFTKVSAHRIL